jgi:tetratricopeptide (TPR) repeat protein
MKAFVNVRIDAEKGEGVEIAKRYNVHGFPTLLIVDASGEEIDRISGYMPPEPFVKEIARIQSGAGTLVALKKAHEAAPDDADAGIAFAQKLSAGKPEEASALFGSLVEKAKDRPTQAKLKIEQAALALASARKKEDVEEVAATAESIVKDYADTPAAGHVVSRLGRAVMFAGEKRALAFIESARPLAADAKERFVVESLAVSVHKMAIGAALKRQGEAAGDDAQSLNEVAWNCFEMKMNAKQALEWAKSAVEKSNRDPAILDTLANLLWLAGKRDEAIKTEEEAAGKAADAMKKEFSANIAKWKAEKKVVGDKKEGDGDGEDDDEDGDGK